MKIKLTIELFLFLCVVLSVPTNATSRAAGRERLDVFSALAQLPTAGTTTNVKIYINGYSRPQDAERLQAVLLKGGPSALLKALRKMKTMGRIQREAAVDSYNFKLILSTTTPTGRHIYAVAERPIGFLEAYYSNRSRDYPFGILELDLKGDDQKEKGEGTLVYAAKIRVIHGEKVEIENLSFAPIKLLGVRQL
jgi:hypothetical protein